MKTLIALATILTCFTISSSQAQTETEIEKHELPQLVQEHLNKKYVKYTVNKITKTEEDTWKISVQKKNKVYALVYTSEGELIGKTKSKVFTYSGAEKSYPKPSPSGSSDGHSHKH